MLYMEIIAFCCQIHTKHINTVCGKNVELLNAKQKYTAVTTIQRAAVQAQRAQNWNDPVLQIQAFGPHLDLQ